MNYEDNFVTYEIAKSLQEKGFNWLCFCFYKTNKEGEVYLNSQLSECNIESATISGEIIAPLWQQAIDWLREKHDIHVLPVLTKKGFYQWQIYNKPKGENTVFSFVCYFITNRIYVIEDALKLI